MISKKSMLRIIPLAAVIFFSTTGSAFAIQAHEGFEGFYVHQIGHVFFMSAMAYIYIVLRRPAASNLEGWRFIRYAAVLFFLWNTDTLISHFLDTFTRQVKEAVSPTEIAFSSVQASLFYLTRVIEYFLLVPAFVMMCVGVYKIRKQLERESA
jgi:hypothetical protein